MRISKSLALTTCPVFRILPAFQSGIPMRYPGNVFTFVLAFAAAAAAHAEIYKCTTKAGMTLYQNFPCAIDSIGSSAGESASARLAASSRDALIAVCAISQ